MRLSVNFQGIYLLENWVKGGASAMSFLLSSTNHMCHFDTLSNRICWPQLEIGNSVAIDGE